MQERSEYLCVAAEAGGVITFRHTSEAEQRRFVHKLDRRYVTTYLFRVVEPGLACTAVHTPMSAFTASGKSTTPFHSARGGEALCPPEFRTIDGGTQWVHAPTPQAPAHGPPIRIGASLASLQ